MSCGCAKDKELVRNKLIAKAARKQAWIDGQVPSIGPPTLPELPEVKMGGSYRLVGYIDSPAGRIAKYADTRWGAPVVDTTLPQEAL